MARLHDGTGDLPQFACQAWRVGNERQWLRVSPPTAAAFFRRTGRRMAPLFRDGCRTVRSRSLHVRKQLPRRQGDVQLPGAVERVQTPCSRMFGRRKGGTLLSYSATILSPFGGGVNAAVVDRNHAVKGAVATLQQK